MHCVMRPSAPSYQRYDVHLMIIRTCTLHVSLYLGAAFLEDGCRGCGIRLVLSELLLFLVHVSSERSRKSHQLHHVWVQVHTLASCVRNNNTQNAAVAPRPSTTHPLVV